MPHERIHRELYIDASPETVWRFVGTAEGLSRWWGAEISLEPRAGGRCEEHLWEDGKRRTLRGVVTAYDPPQHLALTWQPVTDDAADDTEHTDQPAALWPALTTISITLAQEKTGTRVTVVHRAFGDIAAIGVPPSEPAFPAHPMPPAAPPHRREVEALLPAARRASSPSLPALGHSLQELSAANWRRRSSAVLDERMARLSALFPEPVTHTEQ
jgi:uncharacterized protein YndB with AHSA1/START domain